MFISSACKRIYEFALYTAGGASNFSDVAKRQFDCLIYLLVITSMFDPPIVIVYDDFAEGQLNEFFVIYIAWGSKLELGIRVDMISKKSVIICEMNSDRWFVLETVGEYVKSVLDVDGTQMSLL